MLTPGTLVGGYRIERMLGAGGMGTVYLAANPTLPRYDALKVLSAELSRNPDFRARFLREADVAAGLDHPNIVSVYSRGQTEDGQLWIAMQFVDGVDADAALRAGTMTPWRAVHIIGEVAKALDYAHTRGVVHRDIKPANFLVSGPIGPDERVLLGDFGIARALDDVGLTATGSVLATVAYAAPEVLSGLPFDGRADIYSLGCALYALLTGATPFPATNGVAAVMMAHLQRPAPRVTDAVPSLPVGLDGVIATAMAKDPGQRFPSATALADAARAVLADPNRSWTPPPASLPEWPQPGPRRRRMLVAGSVAAAVLLIGGSITALTLNRGDDGGGAGAQVDSALTVNPGRDAGSVQGPPATDVPESALRSILLTVDQIPVEDAADRLVLERDSATLIDDTAPFDDAECAALWAPAQQRVYGNSGFTGVAVQVLRAMHKKPSEDGVIQAVLAFPTQIAAIQALQRQQKQWAACGGRSLTVTLPGEAPQAWELGQPTTISGTVKIDLTPVGGASCQHGIGVRGNVVIDIRQCHTQGGVDVTALVNLTAGKVPRQ
ncbi:serine/threonine-protein kinase PknH/PknJ [[Mycobacterium] nativiensis]|uniref:non-specific serine/threonine protein kinase n=1 Tax=[Mycobacterium] nativiensis TaxID=2855503 RepID=A0ABU5XYK5_9MYCO|nr:serine/threonine-protein kinase PknH/PknJ [Mycolicibacter sp. MYC340]MEB3033074.1 serine/threonine-protein kinase PknH/PknJ [Mycolicibacter sp. MYC340]